MHDLKLCNKCALTKPIEEFPFNKSNKSVNFKVQKDRYRNTCKVCTAEKSRLWRQTKGGINYRGSGVNKLVPKEDMLLMSAIRTRLSSAKGRAVKSRILCELTDIYLYELFIEQDRKCKLTGVTLTLDLGSPLVLSLDQIDSGKGYVVGNVQWIAWAVNRAKGDLSIGNFYSMCEAVLKYRKVQRLSKDSIS